MLDKIFKDLLEIQSVSTNCIEMRNYFQNYLKKFPNYEIIKDNLGSIYAHKKTKSKNLKHLVISSHMDEVGYRVLGIKDNGILELKSIGRISKEIPVGMNLLNKSKNIYGVVVSIPPHLGGNILTDDSILLDIGTSSKEESLKYTTYGDFYTFCDNLYLSINQERCMARGVDNKFGCYLILKAIEYFNNIDNSLDLYLGWNVQEETGIRGAKTSSYLTKPDIFINLDASPVPDALEPNGFGLAKGALIRMKDLSFDIDPQFYDFLKGVAINNNIPYQNFYSAGSTDSSALFISSQGAKGTTIGLPTRYIHSASAIFDFKDLDSCEKLLINSIKELISLNDKQLDELLFK